MNSSIPSWAQTIGSQPFVRPEPWRDQTDGPFRYIWHSQSRSRIPLRDDGPQVQSPSID